MQIGSMWKFLSRGIYTAPHKLFWRRAIGTLHDRSSCRVDNLSGRGNVTKKPSSIEGFRHSIGERWQRFCTVNSKETAFSRNAPGSIDNEESEEEILRIPVPEGIPKDRMRSYLIKDSSRSFGEIKGEDCMFVVHGPEKVWAPQGLVKGHGAGGGIFAVMSSYCGSQFKVMEGDVIYMNRVEGEVNSTYVFDDVLLIGAVDWSILGRPLIRGASVITTIEEQAKSGKIYITKFKKRTGYKRRKGHRQLITRFRIKEIRYSLPDASRVVEFDTDELLTADPLTEPPNFRFRL